MNKFISKLNDNTSKLNKIDYWIMGIMVLIYGIISFYHLGDTISPKTFYSFNDSDEVVITLPSETYVSKMMFYTGNYDGYFEVMTSIDGKEYSYLTDIKIYNVLSWQEEKIDTFTRFLKFTSKDKKTTLGDIGLYDENDNRISLYVEEDNPLFDESFLVPVRVNNLNSLYFDEVYYARSAYEYVNGIDCYEWSHPPLGKLLMAIPILLFGYSPFTSRLMGNIVGILLIPVMYILTKKLFRNRKYAFLGAILMMFDTFHFVHTRTALVDGYQLLFILLSVLFMKNYLDLKIDDSFRKKSINLFLSGLFIGCALATKWNAAYVAIGLAVVFFIHFFKETEIIKLLKENININIVLKWLVFLLLIPLFLYYLSFLIINKDVAKIFILVYLGLLVLWILFALFKFLSKNNYIAKLIIICIVSFVFVPLIICILSYILFPNVDYYNKTLLGIIDQAKLMYDYHSNLVATHPFSSVWYEWPIMYKPVWFYSGTVSNITRTTIVDIGNPAIWWFGIVSFIYVVISAIKKNRESLLILIFILCTFIPYIFIGRIMFMYHYFITLPFVMLGIVGFIKWLGEKFKTDKIYYLYISLVILLFIIFYPVISGMVIGEDYITSLKWLSSWTF